MTVVFNDIESLECRVRQSFGSSDFNFPSVLHIFYVRWSLSLSSYRPSRSLCLHHHHRSVCFMKANSNNYCLWNSRILFTLPQCSAVWTTNTRNPHAFLLGFHVSYCRWLWCLCNCGDVYWIKVCHLFFLTGLCNFMTLTVVSKPLQTEAYNIITYFYNAVLKTSSPLFMPASRWYYWEDTLWHWLSLYRRFIFVSGDYAQVFLQHFLVNVLAN